MIQITLYFFGLFKYIFEFLLSLISGIAFVIWHYRKEIFLFLSKQKLKIFPANFNIALSVDFQEGLNSGNYFKQIKRNLDEILERANLHKLLIIKDFSDVYKFKNKSEAEEFRQRKNLDLIIWGAFSIDGQKKEGKGLHELSLKFTYGCLHDKEGKILSILEKDLVSKFAQKNYWQIVEDNSFSDINIVSQNIYDLAIYTIAITLKIYGYIEKSTKLLECLYNDLLKRKDPLLEGVTNHLINNYGLIVIDLSINGKNYDLGKELCEKMLKLDPCNHFALSNLALFFYKLGFFKASEYTVNDLLQKHPQSSCTKVDVAFFYILKKKYKKAFEWYQKLIKCNIEFNPLYVVEFLDIEYKRNKDPALLYASGIMYYYFIDQNMGKSELKDFLKKAEEKTYKKMYRNAKKLLLS